jgi:hypothetical protein
MDRLMPFSSHRAYVAVVAAVLLTSCSGDGAVRPAPVPVVPPAQPTRSPAPTLSADWREWPIAPGTWRYEPGTATSTARYADASGVRFAVRCDVASRRVTLMRSGSATEMQIFTSSRTARFPTGHVDLDGSVMSAVVLNATDAFLDAMAFSRGRVAIASPGLDGLAVPAWAEPARVIEDCRK